MKGRPQQSQSPSGPRTLSVTERGDGQRLDNFLLRELKGVPKSLVYRLVRKGAVRVDGRRAKVTQRLSLGSEVRVPDLDRPEAVDRDIPPGVLDRLRRSILHEDDQVLVLDKPSGLAVHGGSGLAFGIIEAMRQLRPGFELELGHRLDRETSGCLLLAKSRSGLQDFHAALREGRVEKRYLALQVGAFPSDQPIVCDEPIASSRGPDGKRRMRAGEDADPESARSAISQFVPLERYGSFQLAEVRIGTGRTHQIRVHGQAIGHPVGGDHDYGLPDANRVLRRAGLKRLFLHAQALQYEDSAGESHVYSAPLPDDLQSVLDALASPEASE